MTDIYGLVLPKDQKIKNIFIPTTYQVIGININGTFS